MIKKLLFVLILAVAVLTTCVTLGGSKTPATIEAYKALTDRNPIMTHNFGADPTILVYNDRVYIYMTGDVLEYDHYLEIKTNSYNNINTLRVVSSADLTNWVYHEPIKVAGSEGVARWAQRSWAPAITYKNVNGQDKFFLYFSNNANGVGVLTADSPLGPWTDPIGRALVSRQTPNCSDVPWVFDPAILIDDDGRVYLYFGGGVPQGREADPGSARVVELNSDMISLAGDPVRIDVPYFFEALVMNKINGKYILSYCTNWSVTEQARNSLRIDRAVIAIMSGDNPMGPFKLERTLFRNPGTFFGVWGNNHHDIFQFKGQWYLAYHSQILEEAMGIRGKGYRVTHIDVIRMNNGMFESATGTRRGVQQVGRLNPYIWHQGATNAISAEISFNNEQLSANTDGAWLGIVGADFGDTGAKSITVSAYAQRAERGNRNSIEIRTGSPFESRNSPPSEIIGNITIRNSTIEEHTINLTKTITGIQDIYFIFNGDFILDAWQFNE
ncbi:MAG: glycoside hydrolase family 43 protein [Treponema sp.]|nr:glycoside hydrolase family 43 protein [Treponema sp.]